MISIFMSVFRYTICQIGPPWWKKPKFVFEVHKKDRFSSTQTNWITTVIVINRRCNIIWGRKKFLEKFLAETYQRNWGKVFSHSSAHDELSKPEDFWHKFSKTVPLNYLKIKDIKRLLAIVLISFILFTYPMLIQLFTSKYTLE